MLRGGTGHLWEQVFLPGHVPKNGLLLSLANTGPLLLRNHVITIHDISPYDHPEWFQPVFARWYRFLLPILARRSRLVITDSNFSKSRISSSFNIPPEKIVSIPCGVDLERFSALDLADSNSGSIRKKYGLIGKYILSVGTIEPRKNIHGLIRAWELVKARIAPTMLVVVGEEKQHFRRVGLPSYLDQIKFLGRVPDDHLPALYRGASAFIYPSLYEGFGLPVLEAMACGTPVIASNRTAVPEVVGSAGILVDPTDETNMAESIFELFSRPELQAQLRLEGRQRAEKFSWQSTADRIWEVLSDLAGQ
jgi:glycosyltransferase involved in cell wall biosynthesis